MNWLVEWSGRVDRLPGKRVSKDIEDCQPAVGVCYFNNVKSHRCIAEVLLVQVVHGGLDDSSLLGGGDGVRRRAVVVPALASHLNEDQVLSVASYEIDLAEPAGEVAADDLVTAPAKLRSGKGFRPDS